MTGTVKLRSGLVVLAGAFAVATVGTLGLVVAEMRYVSEQLVAVQERQDALDRQLIAERAHSVSAGDEARFAASEARERAAAERVARLEAVVRGLEERAGKAPASAPTPAPGVTPPRAVTPPPARAPEKAPRVATAPRAAPAAAPARAPQAPGAEDELSPKPAAPAKPAEVRRPEQRPAGDPQPKLFAEPSQSSQPLADRRLGL